MGMVELCQALQVLNAKNTFSTGASEALVWITIGFIQENNEWKMEGEGNYR